MDKRVIICDLDGTISDYSHRVKYYKKRQYEKFNSEGKNDFPIENICNILRYIHSPTNEIVIITARGDNYFNETVNWLKMNDIPFDKLLMRPREDNSPDYECKKKLFENHVNFSDVWFVLEDRKCVVDMWRGEGLTCLQVAPGDF